MPFAVSLWLKGGFHRLWLIPTSSFLYLQNVIEQMRNSLAEARGARGTERNSVGDRDRTNKPPIPPTKAAAVAKIRETIAQAKRESSKDLSQTGKHQRHSVGY